MSCRVNKFNASLSVSLSLSLCIANSNPLSRSSCVFCVWNCDKETYCVKMWLTMELTLQEGLQSSTPLSSVLMTRTWSPFGLIIAPRIFLSLSLCLSSSFPCTKSSLFYSGSSVVILPLTGAYTFQCKRHVCS